ncbi:MAG TPA: VOC family protein [SAR86 cluster bacterium]|nr:VOC family protein [SAR86 cluster bacterium]|tara:strand:- start:2165 stop:2731 length:567 start_codon:yes stop_codon:yes gene_type:complete
MSKTIPEIQHVHHVAYRCRDAEQTRWFYEDILGLKLAAALSFDHISGTDKEMKYMHIFFEMADGNYIAFFDDPHNAPSDFFKDMNGFDSHVAVQVNSMSDLDKVKEQLKSVGWKSFVIDHEFVTSLYIFDPNGIQLEFTCRAENHDQIMEEDANKAHHELKKWTKETRDLKIDKFGNDALDLREKNAK